jgi:hypothetical protein
MALRHPISGAPDNSADHGRQRVGARRVPRKDITDPAKIYGAILPVCLHAVREILWQTVGK